MGDASSRRRLFSAVLAGVELLLVLSVAGAYAGLGETGLSLAGTDIVLLTHLHADHAGELPGLIEARAVAVRSSILFRVFGPEGHAAGPDAAYFPATSRLIDQLFGPQGAFAYLGDFSGHTDFSVTDLSAEPRPGAKAATIYKDNGVEIKAIPGHHRDAPAEIYRIEHGGHSITFSGDIDQQGWADLQTIAQRSDLLVFNSVVLDPGFGEQWNSEPT